MRTKNKYRLLIWIIVILVATNLSMGISFLYHKHQDVTVLAPDEEENIDVPAQQRTRFFREQLNLRNDQMEGFREINRTFNQEANLITQTLEGLRIEMVNELGSEFPDENRLNLISDEIGNLHKQLKSSTIDYYLKMRKICDVEQQEELNEIFMSMLRTNENMELPQGRNRIGRTNNNY